MRPVLSFLTIKLWSESFFKLATDVVTNAFPCGSSGNTDNVTFPCLVGIQQWLPSSIIWLVFLLLLSVRTIFIVWSVPLATWLLCCWIISLLQYKHSKILENWHDAKTRKGIMILLDMGSNRTHVSVEHQVKSTFSDVWKLLCLARFNWSF